MVDDMTKVKERMLFYCNLDSITGRVPPMYSTGHDHYMKQQTIKVESDIEIDDLQWAAPKIPTMILSNYTLMFKIICISSDTHWVVKHDDNGIHPSEVCVLWTQ